MGLTNSHYTKDLDDIENSTIDDPLIRIDVPNMTPIVGVEIKPVVHLKRVGGCVFEWRRMPKPRKPILIRSSSASHVVEETGATNNQQHINNDNSHLATNNEQQQNQENSIVTTTAVTITHTELEDVDISASQSTMSQFPLQQQQQQQQSYQNQHEQQQQQQPLHNNRETRDDITPITNVGIPTELRSVGSMRSLRYIPVKERKGVLVSQGVNYTPTQQDVGHVLKFSVTFIGYQHSITSFVETNPTIPLPSRTPARKWILNQSNVEAEPPQQQNNAISYSLYDASVSSKFTLMSYNITGKNMIQLLRKKQLVKGSKEKQVREICEFYYPACPAYVFGDVYRKKLLLREMLSYNSDIICLQSMHEQLYNEWNIELSKGGYSGIFKTNLVSVTPKSVTAAANEKAKSGNINDSGDLDYSDDAKFGTCIMYRRGKFNKSKDWIVKLSDDADVTSLLNKLSVDHCLSANERTNLINQCKTNRNCGIVTELEFKDMFELMQRFKKKKPNLNFNSVILILACVNIYQQGLDPSSQQLNATERSIMSLIQAHLVLRKIQSVLKDESYAQKGIKTAVVIAGDFDCPSSSLAYDYICKYRSANSDLHGDMIEDEEPSISTSDTGSETGEGHGVDEVDPFANSPSPLSASNITLTTREEMFSPRNNTNNASTSSSNIINSAEVIRLNETTSEDVSPAVRDKVLEHFDHDMRLLSAYQEVIGREALYTLSDKEQTVKDASEFIFFSADELKVTRVAEEPPERTFPNIYFASDHLALLCEFDLNVANNQPEQLAVRRRAIPTSSSRSPNSSARRLLS